MKSFEDKLSGHFQGAAAENSDSPSIKRKPKYPCRVCSSAVTHRHYSVQGCRCGYWVHRFCAGLSVAEIRRIDPSIWHCGCRVVSQDIPDVFTTPAKVFARYVDDIFRSIKSPDIDALFEAANALHPNLKFTIEYEVNGKIPVLDTMIERGDNWVSTSWYHKPTDTGLYLSYHACAPVKYKRNIVEGTVHRIHHATSDWVTFDNGTQKLKEDLAKNQYPPSFVDPIISRTIEKIRQNPSNGELESHVASRLTDHNERPVMVLPYRGSISDQFGKRLKKIQDVSVIFTTRKLKTLMPSLKAPVAAELRSRVVYEIRCSDCNARYVGQTVRHFCTRLKEHRKTTAPVGKHLTGCEGVTRYETKILAQAHDLITLLTMEALHIQRRQPQLNSREEYRQRTLTIRL